MAGNVWQFVNDWYGRDYYSYSPTNHPPGPASGSFMPDGKPYRGMRGGNGITARTAIVASPIATRLAFAVRKTQITPTTISASALCCR